MTQKPLAKSHGTHHPRVFRLRQEYPHVSVTAWTSRCRSAVLCCMPGPEGWGTLAGAPWRTLLCEPLVLILLFVLTWSSSSSLQS